MGRLQRKKSKKKKKKPQKVGSEAALQIGKDVDKDKKVPFNTFSGNAKKTPVQNKVQKITIIDKSLQFLREVKIELKKVVWPSRNQTIGSTVVVILLVFVISLFLGLVDAGLNGIVKMVLG